MAEEDNLLASRWGYGKERQAKPTRTPTLSPQHWAQQYFNVIFHPTFVYCLRAHALRMPAWKS